ncbi:DUF707 domain-containing protein [Acinetobacter sp. SWAC5]|uniref:DUF707 domain-containing protein n=1 Tax=Acinetobacter sp. SWAC5 TaxID=2293835 RepID=UPI000E343852|nr:DUF707 domain-containing protein [Acinetobacter sp. SWAC5]RFS31745.1 DUF707 domain-containing protein [Acinetobacter sp. SWAC5]
MKNLIVVRCGDNSLHEKWISSEANYDVVISYFGNEPKFDLENLRHFHSYKGSKWEGLNDFFQTNDFWREYDAIWLPDDDIDTDVQSLNKFFELFHEYQFDIAQPSLDERSYFSWAILLKNKNFKYRKTNFVEVMIPCFNKATFNKIFHTFSENKSGWGLDFLWPQILGEQANIAVIDEVAVFHTRPVGSAGSGMGKKNLSKKSWFTKNTVLSPLEELKIISKKYNLVQKERCLSGIDMSGKYLDAAQVEFKQLYLAGCDLRLLEKLEINFALENLECKK